MAFREGYATGTMAGSPLEGLLSAVNKKFQERNTRRAKDAEEEKSLTSELVKLTAIENVKSKYAKEQTAFSEEEKRKTEIAKQEQGLSQTSAILKQFGMEGGTNLPPGTTVKAGNFTIPLNPKLTQEQGASVAAAKEVEDDVNSFKTLLTKHKGEAGSIAKLTLPYALVGGDTEEMKRITDQLRARIPFAKGGKQLTPFEAKTLFQLLPQPGQSETTINKNLDKFVSEFNKMSEIAIKGTAGTGQNQTLGQGKYKAGDTKNIKGINYTRNEAGQWLPQ